MRPLRNAVRHIAIISAIFLLSIATGCSKPAEKPKAPSDPAATQADQSPAASKLGDLSEFHVIAVDVANLVHQHHLAAGKIRIKDLESRWDSAEAGLKPRAAADWHMLDKAIDRALSALRAGTPDPAECQAAMDDLLKMFDSLQKNK